MYRYVARILSRWVLLEQPQTRNVSDLQLTGEPLRENAIRPERYESTLCTDSDDKARTRSQRNTLSPC